MKNERKFLDVASHAFIEATNGLLDLYHEQPAKITLTEEFSKIVLNVYQNFMLDVLPSSQCLVDKKNFFSFAILCRSSLDIIIQILWILSLEEDEKLKAIEYFLNFEGVDVGQNGKKIYEWQRVFRPTYSSKKTAMELGIDKECIILPLTQHKNKELKLTVFDYLSKITHWNPRLLNDLVGCNSEKHLGNAVEHTRMAAISVETFIFCAITFTEIFLKLCLKVDEESVNQKTSKIKEKFRGAFAPFYNDIEQETEVVIEV
ncbi:hypothetical protein [Legionella pneumophila]|uniref:hypothetical protein n=1 Tax=Legionella pneumophila TaxID=446 RepID=UPI0001527637|nr:hypothetical protein [Legionella pneumophila]HAT8879187.1 hypothetical protein [Legionella pneumophila subsp. pneumophila]ABQ54202.1 hypothetical protein LPC_0204 [Legionella pneumophila str. Corby]ADG23439.1 hypothetical protein lpa_00274 [Legionella pneumophila 2300/99 Alcoy]CZH77706.1 Uncharacterised protein [Legionella pneumophila]CZH84123.1 Uncharacterised protein [Legionella pneumophila]